MSFTRRSALGLMAGATLAPTLAQAQWSPGKVVKIVVPYPAGGPTDVLARLIAQEISGPLGQQVIVENMPGASGAVGTRAVAKADPDGTTIMAGNNQTHGSNVFLLKDLGYDAVKDFAPVAGTVDLQHALVVKKDLPVKNVQELVALAKSQPGKLNYGSTGNGSGSHLAMELFRINTGIDMVHVPFRGAAQLAQEMVGGRIDVAFSTLSAILGQVQGGTIRAIAIASDNPAPQLPDVPLLKNQGVANNEFDSWNGIFAPAGTPAPVLARLTEVVLAALKKPAVIEGALKQGILVNPRTPEQWKTYHAAELAKLDKIIKQAGVKMDG
ncbi:MAG: Bug family tripartite tricarboxylate transporter substrate binding protein [Beijerinckiaceae bacterium]